MKADEIVLKVKAKMTVDRKTAEACLKMVEMYVNESGVNVECCREESGEYSFRFTDQTPREDC